MPNLLAISCIYLIYLSNNYIITFFILLNYLIVKKFKLYYIKYL